MCSRADVEHLDPMLDPNPCEATVAYDDGDGTCGTHARYDAPPIDGKPYCDRHWAEATSISIDEWLRMGEEDAQYARRLDLQAGVAAH